MIEKLTAKQEIFAQKIAAGSTQAAAYRAVFSVKNMQDSSIHEEASRLMAQVKVSSRVAALQAAAADIVVLDRVEIMREIQRLAHSDIGGIMHENGRVKLPNELDPVTRAAVKSFEIDEYGRIKYQFWDKNTALTNASKIVGLFELDNKQKTDPLAELLKGLSGNVLGVTPGGAEK